MNKWTWTRAGIGLIAALGAAASQAVDLPRWELGVGLGSFSVPDYRGSDERRQFVLPAPYLVYRGDTVKADREGARAQLFGSGDVHLDIYLGGSLPVSSTRNRARVGMPPLKGSLDLGPALDVRLSESADQRVLVKVRVPVSYGFTLGKPQQGLGWQTSPVLGIYTRDVFGWSGWAGNLQTGPMFATRQRNARFYDVDEAYATDTRPAYRAGAGYAGWQFQTSLSRRFERFWLGAFARYDNISRTAFNDSPLVKTHQYLMGGVALIWVMGESAERVKVD